MFGKQSHRDQKNLEEHGRRAEAVVLDIAERGMALTTGSAQGIVANTEVSLKARLRVEPDGEVPFEVDKLFRFPQLSLPSVGSRLSVIYDPDDHDNIMVDRSFGGVKVAGTDLGSILATVKANSADPNATRQDLAAALTAQLGLTDSSQFMPGGLSAFGVGSAPTPPAADPIEKLEKLGKLRDSGVLTDEEFAAQKAKLLAEDM